MRYVVEADLGFSFFTNFSMQSKSNWSTRFRILLGFYWVTSTLQMRHVSLSVWALVPTPIRVMTWHGPSVHSQVYCKQTYFCKHFRTFLCNQKHMDFSQMVSELFSDLLLISILISDKSYNIAKSRYYHMFGIWSGLTNVLGKQLLVTFRKKLDRMYHCDSYHPQTKLREGNLFTGICLSTEWVGNIKCITW